MATKYEASGTVYHVGETKSVGAKGFKKRELVLRTGEDSKWPQLVAFEATGDTTSDLDGLNMGDAVTVHFDLNGREWSGPNGVKFFTTLKAWKVDVTGKAKHAPARPLDDGGALPF